MNQAFHPKKYFRLEILEIKSFLEINSVCISFVTMKVKMLRRKPEDYIRESKHDIHKLNRNYK